MNFQLTPEDAEILRHLVRIEPVEARSWLQDRPELTRRMMGWPVEIRTELCQIIYRSFTPEQQERIKTENTSSDILKVLGKD